MRDWNRRDEMGSYRFRLSDIMPSAWLHRLKATSRNRSRKHLPSQPPSSSSQAARHPTSPQFPPDNKRSKRKTIYKPSPRLKLSASSSKSHPRSSSSADLSANHDIVINMKDVNGFTSSSSSEKENLVSTQIQRKLISAGRKSTAAAATSGIRLRVNSPKIARKKTTRKSMSSSTATESKNKVMAESFAIVMSSVDPERDFKESMVEMIEENKMRETKDLEDLLACYLSLNSTEYHDIIIKAFEKTWFELTNLSL